jgi:hypothetical protein
MNSKHETNEIEALYDQQPPFVFEIRVKGRLSDVQWTSWFDDLTVTAAQGESTLRGKVPDHAALYGLLARLRDLAIPLVAVRVLDAEAQGKLIRQGRRYDLMINGLLVALYLLLLGGLTTITVFIAPMINVALALTQLFALLGALAFAFGLWSDQQAWRWLSYALWIAAVITFLVFIPLSGLMPPALGIAIMLFLAAGGLLYVIYFLRRHVEDINSRLAGGGSRPYRPDDSTARGDAPVDAGREVEAAEQEASVTD